MRQVDAEQPNIPVDAKLKSNPETLILLGVGPIAGLQRSERAFHSFFFCPCRVSEGKSVASGRDMLASRMSGCMCLFALSPQFLDSFQDVRPPFVIWIAAQDLLVP